MTFEASTAFGDIAENLVGRWFRSRGNSVLPAYQLEIESGKGPRFFTPTGELIAPDMFLMPCMVWAEVKHKKAFTWYRRNKEWTTGIDIKHYSDYQEVQKVSRRDVWLMFLHSSATPDQRDLDADRDCPRTCPTGLYGSKLKILTKHESHKSFKEGMVYWEERRLKRFASLGELSELEDKAA